MTTLIIGPSSVGKSTFLKSNRIAELLAKDGYAIKFGRDIAEGGLLDRYLVHYNLLHHAVGFGDDLARCSSEWDIENETIFKSIISQNIEKAIVLVSPLSELRERMAKRTKIEDNVDAPYPSSYWMNVLGKLDLFAIYEQMFDALERRGIDCEVVFPTKINLRQRIEYLSTPIFVGKVLDCRLLRRWMRLAQIPIAITRRFACHMIK